MKPETRERFIPDYLIGIVGKNVLKAHAASEKGPKELAEVKARLELAKQLRSEETTQKQALQEAFEKEKNKLLNEIATLQKRAKCAENQVDKMAKWSEFKGHAKELKATRACLAKTPTERGASFAIQQSVLGMAPPIGLAILEAHLYCKSPFLARALRPQMSVL